MAPQVSDDYGIHLQIHDIVDAYLGDRWITYRHDNYDTDLLTFKDECLNVGDMLCWVAEEVPIEQQHLLREWLSDPKNVEQLWQHYNSEETLFYCLDVAEAGLAGIEQRSNPFKHFTGEVLSRGLEEWLAAATPDQFNKVMAVVDEFQEMHRESQAY